MSDPPGLGASPARLPAADGAGERMAVVALALSVVIGLLGAVLGAAALSRIPRRGGRRRGLAVAAVVIGVIQTAAVLLLVSTLAAQPPEEPPTAALPASTSSGGAEPSPTATAAPGATPSPSAPRDLSEVIPLAAGSFAVVTLTEDPEPVTRGAIEAYQATFSNGADVIALLASQWASAEQAAAVADQAAVVFEPELLDSGAVGDPPVGTYRYAEPGGVATVVWTNGPYLFQASGSPAAVQDFYLSSPM